MEAFECNLSDNCAMPQLPPRMLAWAFTLLLSGCVVLCWIWRVCLLHALCVKESFFFAIVHQHCLLHCQAYNPRPRWYPVPSLLWWRSSWSLTILIGFPSSYSRPGCSALSLSRKKLRRQWKPLPTLIKEKEPLWYRVPQSKLLHREKERKNQWAGIKRVAGLAWNRLLMRVDNSTGKGTSGMDKFSSEVHRVHMELGGELLKFENQDPVPWKASECECCRWYHPHPKGWCGD